MGGRGSEGESMSGVIGSSHVSCFEMRSVGVMFSEAGRLRPASEWSERPGSLEPPVQLQLQLTGSESLDNDTIQQVFAIRRMAPTDVSYS